MLDALRFVATAIAKKDYVPELTHYRIRAGRVTGYNGAMALSSPIDVDLDIQPKAKPLLAAVQACPGVIALHVTAAGKLAIKSERFKAYIDCLPTDAVHTVHPAGEEVELGPNFMNGIRAIAPIMGIDASRPWAMGIKLQNESMFATNNIMLVEYWHGHRIPIDVVIPAQAINELLRIGESPRRVQVTDNSISFWFENDRWLRAQLIEGSAWPTDRMNELMAHSKNEPSSIGEDFETALHSLKPFLDDMGAVYMTSAGLGTAKDEGVGAFVDVPIAGVSEMQCYHHKNLTLLCEVADRIDWTSYPRPCAFYKGDRLRGVIIGRRV